MWNVECGIGGCRFPWDIGGCGFPWDIGGWGREGTAEEVVVEGGYGVDFGGVDADVGNALVVKVVLEAGGGIDGSETPTGIGGVGEVCSGAMGDDVAYVLCRERAVGL